MQLTSDYTRRVPCWRCCTACRRRLGLRRTVALVAVVVFAGCGGSHITVQPPPKTSGSTPLTTPAQSGSGSSTGDNGQDPKILAAYAGSVTDFDAVATKAPIQGNSPILGNHMAGQELEGVVSHLLGLAEQNQVNTGLLSTIHANVKQFTGTKAVVIACNRDTVGTADASSGRIITQPAPSTELVNAIVQETDGVWKVTYVSNVSAGCS